MSTYPVKKLLDLWAQGRLTLEQAIGHILQRLLDHEALLGLPAARLGAVFSLSSIRYHLDNLTNSGYTT
ncbi:MAG: hypothetical protein R3C14_12550 [Caldilineaceae bacterium]